MGKCFLLKEVFRHGKNEMKYRDRIWCASVLITAFVMVSILTASDERIPRMELMGVLKDRPVEELLALLIVDPDLTARQVLANGATALHMSAYYDRADSVRHLLRSGAKPNDTTENGVTPLHVAARRGSAGTAYVLIKGGAELNLVGGPHMETPLHIAARNGNADVVRLLLQLGADPDVKDSNGRTALASAKAAGHSEVETILGRGLFKNTASKQISASPSLIQPLLPPFTPAALAVMKDETQVYYSVDEAEQLMKQQASRSMQFRNSWAAAFRTGGSNHDSASALQYNEAQYTVDRDIYYRTVAKLIAQFDVDGDGMISVGEAAPVIEELRAIPACPHTEGDVWLKHFDIIALRFGDVDRDGYLHPAELAAFDPFRSAYFREWNDERKLCFGRSFSIPGARLARVSKEVEVDYER